jgi:hypothetical protein
MRMEATIPDSRGKAAVELAEELGLSRSQLVDEALGLYLKIVLEVRRGRRITMSDPLGKEPTQELATPALAALEWALRPARVEVSGETFKRIHAITEKPVAAGDRLRKAARRQSR